MLGPELRWPPLTMLFVLLLAGPARCDGLAAGVEETPLGPVNYDNASWVLSPDGHRLACTLAKGRKWCVAVDGVEGRTYSSIVKDTLVFSPDGSRVGYRAWKGDKLVCVVDGAEGPPFDGGPQGGPLFSPDGQHVVYAAVKGDKWVVVADGQVGQPYDGISKDSPSFGPGGALMVYLAYKGARSAVVTNGVEGPWTDGVGAEGWLFSPDGRRLAYRAKSGDSWAVVVDGVAGKPYHAVERGSLAFSPDGARLAYFVETAPPVEPPPPGDDKVLHFTSYTCALVVDGTAGDPFDAWLPVLSPPIFSPDSAHIAYVRPQTATRGPAVVLDGVAGPEGDSIAGAPAFGPDGALQYLECRDGTLYRVRHVPAGRSHAETVIP